MMSETELRHKLAKFGEYELDCSSGRLINNGVGLNIEPLVFQFLLLLIKHNGEVVSKKTVIETLWPYKTPSDEALRAMVKKAREVLKDNARNPSYIKTIPTKGYLLIPNVVLKSTIVQSWFEKHQKHLLYLGLVVTLCVVAYYFYFLSHNDIENNTYVQPISKTELSLINSDEVNAYYVNNVLSNIAIVNDLAQSFSQLIIENISTQERINFTFNGPLAKQFLWSEKLNLMLVTRSDFKSFFSVELDKNGSEHLVIEYDYEMSNEYKLLAIRKEGLEIYALNVKEQRIDIINMATQDITEFLSINRLNSESEAEERQGFDGMWLNPKTGLLFVAIGNGETFKIFEISEAHVDNEYWEINDNLIAELDGKIESAIWDKSGNRFSFSTNTGQLYSYQVSAKVLTTWETGSENVKGLIADCGDSCFVVSNTKGLSKLLVINKPFNMQSSSAFFSTSNSKPRTEQLPLFFEKKLYFVLSDNQNSFLSLRTSISNTIEESIIYDFGKHSKITELAIDNEGKLIGGLVNQRPFILDIDSRELVFIGITFPQISELGFNKDNKLSFYADPVNQSKGVYEFDVQTKQVSLKYEGVRYLQNLLLQGNDESNQSRYRAEFIIDEAYTAIVKFQNGKNDIPINLYNKSCLACLHIEGNFLYQLDTLNQPSIVKTNLFSGESQTEIIPVESLSGEFSIAPSTNKMAIVNRQQLQTKLVKIEGLRQIY